MVQSVIADDSKGIFKRPTSVEGILEGRMPIEVKRFEDIIENAEHRGKNALLLYGFNLVPQEFYSAVNFGKRGPLVSLETFGGNVQKLGKNEWSDLKARIKASEEYKGSNERAVGWTWVDPEGRHHVLRPTTNLEGHRLHMWSLQSKSIEDKIELRKPYSSADAHTKAITALVPSRSGQKKHEIIINHVTDASDPQRFAEWTRIDTNHFCPSKRWDKVTFRFEDRGGHVNYCAHDVAAYMAHARKVAEEKRRIIPQPFPLPTEPYVRLANTLLYHTVKVDMVVKGGKIHTHSRPLTLPEADVILMEAWKDVGNRHTLFVEVPTKTYKRSPPTSERKTMRQYDWSPDAEGMPFRRD